LAQLALDLIAQADGSAGLKLRRGRLQFGGGALALTGAQ
jgi:hypothetical protein